MTNQQLKDEITHYIKVKQQLDDNHRAAVKDLENKAIKLILNDCPIKVGDVYVTEVNNAWGTDRKYYKVTKVTPSIDGFVKVEGNKRKLDRMWGKREVFMFYVSLYEDYRIKDFEKVDNYVEPNDGNYEKK